MKLINKCIGIVGIFLFALSAVHNIKAATVVVANDMSEVVSFAEAATQDTTIQLSDSFPETIVTPPTITITNDVAITIDGNKSTNTRTTLRASATKIHLTVLNQVNIAGRVKPFTFKNINFVGDTASDIRANRTGGLRISGKNFIVNNSDFTSNYGAILLSAKVEQLDVSKTTFTDNYYSTGAGAIHGEKNLVALNVIDSTFTHNIGSGFGYNGGAIWIKYGQNIDIQKTNFINNTSDGTGGGGALALTVGANTGKINIDSSYFKGNRADTHPSIYAAGSAWSDGGAIYMYTLGDNQEFNLSNSLFDGNYAQDDGGALLLERVATGNPDTPTTVVNNTFINNNAVGKGIATPIENGGGAIQVSQKTKSTIDSNTIVNNNAGGIGESQAARGGGLASYNAGLTPACVVTNNIILGNTITDSTGTITNSLFSNVEADDIIASNNIGIDNGTALPANVSLDKIFGTNNPSLVTNFSNKVAGADSLDSLKTLPIIPTGLADDTGNTSLVEDSRGFTRNNPTDIGAVDMIYLKFSANGGQWNNLPNLVFDGTRYYTNTNTDTYYLLSHNSGSISALTNTNLTKSGSIFKGWSTTPNGSVEYNANEAINLTSDTLLYAVWQESAVVKYTVTFDSQGGSAVNPITNIDANSTIKAPKNPTKKGYTFKGWYKQKDLTSLWSFTNDRVVSNITLYAKWDKNSIAIDNGLPKAGSSLALLSLLSLTALISFSLYNIKKNQ